MIPELMEMAKAGAMDLAAREAMGLLDILDQDLSEREFLDLVCEVAAEHVPPPADKSLESFDLLVGGTIAAFFSYKAFEITRRMEDLPE